MFILISVFFIFIPQVMMMYLGSIFPIVIASGIVEFIFILLELCWSIYVIIAISQKNVALDELRNSQIIKKRRKKAKIKTSEEIEDELYSKYPKLRTYH